MLPPVTNFFAMIYFFLFRNQTPHIKIASKKSIFFVAIFCCCLRPYTGVSQQPVKFTLVVNYKAQKNDTLYAGESYYLKQYRSAKFFNDMATIDNNKYFFTGEILYPTAIRIFPSTGKPNKLIFIDSGYQEINLNRRDSVIALSSISLTKVEKEHREFIKQIGVSDIGKKLPEKNLEKYVKENPNSYIALFALINQTFNYNFSPGLKRIASYFDSSIKASRGYQYYVSQYIVRRKIPALTLQNEKKEDIQLNFVVPNNKYTFVEFWFTGCTGCIPVMLYIKQHYKHLSNKIRIVTVCTDKNLALGSLKILKNLAPPWKNYWDYNATQFEKYTNLYKYPSNLLIDNNGQTVAKDINISEIFGFISP